MKAQEMGELTHFDFNVQVSAARRSGATVDTVKKCKILHEPRDGPSA